MQPNIVSIIKTEQFSKTPNQVLKFLILDLVNKLQESEKKLQLLSEKRDEYAQILAQLDYVHCDVCNSIGHNLDLCDECCTYYCDTCMSMLECESCKNYYCSSCINDKNICKRCDC